MPFTPDIAIDDATPTEVNFNFISNVGSKTIRKDPARDVDSPRVMTISHEVSGKGSSAVDRHLLRFDQTEVDPNDDSSIATASAHVVLTMPRKNITNAMMLDLAAFITNYLVEANIEKLLNGEPG